MHMEHRQKNRGRRQAENLKELRNSPLKSEVGEFRALLKRNLPDLQSYIARRLNMAHATGALSRQALSVKEILDTVYLELFERFKDRPGETGGIETFIYKVVDEILERELDEIEYERKYFIDLHQLESREWKDLEEKFTVDADGELVMADELDDVSYDRKMYGLASVALEDSDAFSEIETPLQEYDKKFIHQEIRKQLMKLPEKERTVFDLFWLEEMDLDQIASIRNLSVPETEELLKKVTLDVKQGLEEKFKRTSR